MGGLKGNQKHLVLCRRSWPAGSGGRGLCGTVDGRPWNPPPRGVGGGDEPGVTGGGRLGGGCGSFFVIAGANRRSESLNMPRCHFGYRLKNHSLVYTRKKKPLGSVGEYGSDFSEMRCAIVLQG